VPNQMNCVLSQKRNELDASIFQIKLPVAQSVACYRIARDISRHGYRVWGSPENRKNLDISKIRPLFAGSGREISRA